MLRLSIMLLVLIGALACESHLPAEPVGLSPNAPSQGGRIILFGASWCAPCLAELRDLSRLAAAVAPDRLVVVWTDGDVGRLLATRPSNVDLVEGAKARRGLEVMGGDVGGLPYAVMLDAQGRRCAEWRGPLTVADIPRFRSLCR